MSNVKDFILEDMSVLEETKKVSFPQYKKPFVIRSIGAEELQEIQKAATSAGRNKKTGLTVKNTDNDRLLDLMIEKAVVTPDLMSTELQKAFDVKDANPATLLRKMLRAGQYMEMVEEIQTISGFDIDEAIVEIKN